MYFSIAELWFPGENTGIMLPGAASSCPQQKTWEYLPEGCVAFSLQLSSYHCTHTPTWFLAHLLFGGHTTQHRLISCMMPSGLSLTQWGNVLWCTHRVTRKYLKKKALALFVGISWLIPPLGGPGKALTPSSWQNNCKWHDQLCLFR